MISGLIQHLKNEGEEGTVALRKQRDGGINMCGEKKEIKSQFYRAYFLKFDGKINEESLKWQCR